MKRKDIARKVLSERAANSPDFNPPYVSGDPEVFVVHRKLPKAQEDPGEIIILGSDGLWDCMEESAVAALSHSMLAAGKSPGDVARALSEEVLKGAAEATRIMGGVEEIKVMPCGRIREATHLSVVAG